MSTTALVKAAVPGSLAHQVQQRGITLAEAMLDAALVVIFDHSSSMLSCDAGGGRSRYEAARQELTKLQALHPGRIVLIGFSEESEDYHSGRKRPCAEFHPGGVPPEPRGGTDMAGALRFARDFDDTGLAFVIISDGEPNHMPSALDEAKRFKSPISTIFVGREDDQRAQQFLRDLAAKCGGSSTVVACVGQAGLLSGAVQKLLPAPKAGEQ